jgi:hypothetical protein
MSISIGSDRRNHIRVIPDRSESVSVDINGANFIEILKVVDISEGGVGVKVPHGFIGCDLNQPIAFVLTIPQPKRVLVRGSGHIRHISGNRFGIAFNTLPDNVVEQIRNYIALHIREESLLMWAKYKMGFIS